MEAFFNHYGTLLVNATLETIYMTAVSTFFSYILGVPLGVALSVTKKGGIAESPVFNNAAGWVVNILRSVPFIILMVFVIPFTRLIAGTSIGPNAGNIPLIIAATPFVARIVEQSIEEVDKGLIEAAKCMGATNFQIITKVMLKESRPSLIRGLSISAITILSYSAITGTIGAGGLGDMAIRYGYQQYIDSVMYSTVILLIIIVMLIQWLCNIWAFKADKRNKN
ncbi:MAG: ABC transporter permease [Mucispirillum sp.]|uniref:ABC transporter permease n=1 Tax=Candidatus Mucispirillum faecigallinarum TaxID=2838699 RepID=A0A9D2KAA7_9BACT|nr:ABC transporter permease [Mucispirillum sp.]HIZ88550.1 ABC transporter permease [Candidatus Mucispirillum faecigallinarum]